MAFNEPLFRGVGGVVRVHAYTPPRDFYTCANLEFNKKFMFVKKSRGGYWLDIVSHIKL